MKVRFWQVLCFVLLVVGLSVAVFPGRRSLVSVYLKEGDLQTARVKLEELMEEGGAEELRLLESELLTLEGYSEEAIAELERLARDNPENVMLLTRLAKYYEWDREAQKALEAWEKIAALTPGNKEALKHQIDYYRYFRLPQKEAEAIARLFVAESKSWKGPSTPLLDILNDELRVAAERRAVSSDTTHFNTLLSGLYLLKTRYLDKLRKDRDVSLDGGEEIIGQCYRLFLQTNNLERGLQMASRLDALEATDLARRQQLLNIVLAEGTSRDVLYVLTEMRREFPADKEVLAQFAQLGGSFGDLGDNIEAFEGLVAQNPDRTDFKERLASLYLELGDLNRAYRTYHELAEVSREPSDVSRMLRVAGYTDDPVLLIEAVEGAIRLRPDDPALLSERARTYLAVKGPREAYPFYRELALIRKGDEDSVSRMMEVAGYTDDSLLIQNAAAEALRLRPGDRRVVLKAASILLEQNKPREAYPLYRAVATARGGDSDDVLQMLKVAEYTDDGDVMEEAAAEALRLLPDTPEVVARAGSIYLARSMPREAYPLYRSLASIRKDRESTLRMMEIAGYTDDGELIEDSAEEGLRLRPEDGDVLLKAASILLARNRPQEAYPLYRKLVSRGEGDRDVVLQMIRAAGYAGDSALAAESAEEVMRLFPDDGELLEKSGSILLYTDRYRAAYDVYRRLAELSGGQAEAVLRMMAAAGATEKKEVLGEALARAMEMQPDDLEVLEKASQMYLWIDESAEALKVLIKIARLKGEDEETVARMVEVADFTKEVDLQREAFQIAHELHPDDTAFMMKSFDLAREQGDFEKAIAIYEAYGRKKTLDGKETAVLADLYEENAQPLEAYALLKKLYVVHPNKISLQRRMLYLAAMADMSEDAATFFREQALENPEDYSMNLVAGDVLLGRDREEEGIRFMEKALALRPDNELLQGRLAKLYYDSRSYERAIVLLEQLKGSGRLTESQGFLLNMAYLKSANGAKVVGALSHHEKAEKLPLTEGMMLADAYEALGRDKDTLRIYRRLARENMDDTAFLAEMGKQTLWMGHADLAKELFERVLKREPQNLQALKFGGQAYAENREPRKAIRSFLEYVRLHPGDYEAHYHLGEAYLAAGDKDRAFDEYRKSEQLILEDRALRSGGKSGTESRL